MFENDVTTKTKTSSLILIYDQILLSTRCCMSQYDIIMTTECNNLKIAMTY